MLPVGSRLLNQQNQLSKIQRKGQFFNRLNYAVKKNSGVCIDVQKSCERNDKDSLLECSSISKNRKVKNKDVLVAEYENMDEDFEQNYYSKTAKSSY